MNNKTMITKSFQASEEDLKKINQFTRRELSKDEVYTFSVILCDNEVDRDYERFDINSLHQLAKMYIGKTGIFDHNLKGENQTARIFDTKVEINHQKITSCNEPYTYIKAMAYMMKNAKNQDLISEIDGGIKKEVSVSCSVSKTTCSICSSNKNNNENCSHKKGKKYHDKICHHVLSEPLDVYEWSFVAVPAQKNAGVTKSLCLKKEEENINTEILFKSFSEEDDSVTLSKDELKEIKKEFDSLKEKALLGQEYKEELVSEIIKLSFLANDTMKAETLSSISSKLSINELKELKKAYQSRISNSKSNIQLASKNTKEIINTMNEFKL